MPEAEQYPEAIVKATDTEAELQMPMEGGGYRLYAYVRSEKGCSAVANLILYAKGPLPKPKTPKATLPFVILSPNQKDPSYFPSGWIGNGSAVGYAADCTIHPRSGTTCMKLEYRDPGQFGGIVWQNPANDWGDKHGGFNLTGAQKLTVWSRGEKGGEKVEFSYGGIMTNKPYCDSSEMKLKVKLTKEWEPYTIDLTGKDLTRIKSGFGWRVEGAGKPVTFYIDDVRYE